MYKKQPSPLFFKNNEDKANSEFNNQALPQQFLQSKGVWQHHLQRMLNILKQDSYRNRALKKLHNVCRCTPDGRPILQMSLDLFKKKGLIFALVHLRTNSIYVSMTNRAPYKAIKHHWYAAEYYASRFHKLLLDSKLRDYFVWPLESIDLDYDQAKIRKQFWIQELLGSSSKKISNLPSSPQSKDKLSQPRSFSPCRDTIKVWRPKLQQESTPIMQNCARTLFNDAKPQVMKYHWKNLKNETYKPFTEPTVSFRDESKFPHPDKIHEDNEGYQCWVQYISGFDDEREYSLWYEHYHEIHDYDHFYPYTPVARDFEDYPLLPIDQYPHPDLLDELMDMDSWEGWTEEQEKIYKAFRSFKIHMLLLSRDGDIIGYIAYRLWYLHVRPELPSFKDFQKWYRLDKFDSNPDVDLNQIWRDNFDQQIHKSDSKEATQSPISSRTRLKVNHDQRISN